VVVFQSDGVRVEFLKGPDVITQYRVWEEKQ